MGTYWQRSEAGVASLQPRDGSVSHGLHRVPAICHRLFEAGDSKLSSLSPRLFRRTAFVSRDDLPDGGRLALVEIGGLVCSYESLSTLDGVLSSQSSTVDSVLVDVDGCGGIVQLIDSLMQFRRKHPFIPVILASREVQCDDLSEVRLTIADATVKLPLSRARIIEAQSAAVVNNGIWRDRVRNKLDAAKRLVQ